MVCKCLIEAKLVTRRVHVLCNDVNVPDNLWRLIWLPVGSYIC